MVSEKRIDMKKLEALLELGGIKKNVTLLALSGAAVICSLCGVQLGGLLEELTVAKARAGIEKLLHLMPQTARVGSGGEEKIIPAEEVQAGEILRVLPGESIPVDGVIVSGQTSINQAVMTGESLPVDKTAGDEVSSGTINQFGAFDRKVTKVGLADRFATWVVVIALTAAGLTWAISGEIIRAVTILVVFCPCALALATPTAIMAAIGNATKHGFLVREGDALERLAGAKVFAFDKTGTLTLGTPEVTQVLCADDTISEDVLLRLAAAAERKISDGPGPGRLCGRGGPYGSGRKSGAAGRTRRFVLTAGGSQAGAERGQYGDVCCRRRAARFSRWARSFCWSFEGTKQRAGGFQKILRRAVFHLSGCARLCL